MSSSSLVYVGMFFFLVFLLVTALKLYRRIGERNPALLKAIMDKLPEVLKLLTGMVQILSAFATVLHHVKWPSAFSNMMGIFGFLSMDIFQLPVLRCSSVGDSFYARFDAHMTIVLIATGVFAFLLWYAVDAKKSGRPALVSPSNVWSVFLPFLFIIYPSISKTVILMLRCRTIDGRSYLLSDLALSCETARYARHKAYAIFGVLVFPIGVAVFFTSLVGHNRRKLPPDWWPAHAEEQAPEEEAETSFEIVVSRTFIDVRPLRCATIDHHSAPARLEYDNDGPGAE